MDNLIRTQSGSEIKFNKFRVEVTNEGINLSYLHNGVVVAAKKINCITEFIVDGYVTTLMNNK